MGKLALIICLTLPIRIGRAETVTRGHTLGSIVVGFTAVLLSSFTGATLDAEGDIDTRRRRKAKRNTHGLQIQVVHIENITMGMTCVGQNITSIRIARRAIEVIILFNQALQLTLNIGNLARRELIFVQGYLGGFQVS